MATALLVSITFGCPMEDALAMIMGVYCGGVYGGSIFRSASEHTRRTRRCLFGFDGYPSPSEVSFNGLGLAG
jgi:putative tricarboxylic transport membrane protein